MYFCVCTIVRSLWTFTCHRYADSWPEELKNQIRSSTENENMEHDKKNIEKHNKKMTKKGDKSRSLKPIDGVFWTDCFLIKTHQWVIPYKYGPHTLLWLREECIPKRKNNVSTLKFYSLSLYTMYMCFNKKRHNI